MAKLTVDIAGWIGSFIILFAYYGVSAGRLEGTGTGYQGLNVTGSILLVINTIYYGAYPSSFVNVVWAFIGVAALIRRPKPGAE